MSVAQHRFLAREARVRYHDVTTTRGVKGNWEISATFVTTWRLVRLSFFYGFYVFLRTINLRSRLTILSNLNSVERLRTHTLFVKRRHGVPGVVVCPSLKKRQGVFFFFQEGQW